MYRKYFKRLFDITVSLIALVISLPILILFSLLIKSEDLGPIIFRQERVGKDGKKFVLIKLRSMCVGTRDVPSANAKNMPVTKVGKIIRRFNIDEIPQFFLVLKGDMCVVGPRPPLPSQIKLIELRKQNGAIACKPGLTGLAQINAYDGMPEEEKAVWDGKYYREMSFFLDVCIIYKTFLYFLKRPPVY